MPASFPSTRLLRAALWFSVWLNACGAILFLLPALGKPCALMPVETPRFFAAQMAFTIALFGGVYAWLARQEVINRALVVVGGLGKLGFFALTVIHSLAGDLPARMAWQALPDVVLGFLFLAWALRSGRGR